MAMLEAQLSQLRTEKHFLLNSVVQSQKKDEIIHILIDQLKYNAPRQYLVDTAAQIRRMTAEDSELQHPFHQRDKDIEDVCRLLEEPVDLVIIYLVSYYFLFKTHHFLYYWSELARLIPILSLDLAPFFSSLHLTILLTLIAYFSERELQCAGIKWTLVHE